MKKLMFVLVCVVLVAGLCAAPAPAKDSAPPYPSLWYAVSPFDGTVWLVDEANDFFEQVDAVPAGCEYVAFNVTLYAATYGQTIAQTNDLDQTLEFWKGEEGASPDLLSLDVRAAKAGWGRPYDPHAAYGVTVELYNPKVQSGFWARDWVVWVGPLDAGTYGFHHRYLQAHSGVDPHFERTPIHYWSTGEWIDSETLTFVVE